MLNIISLGAGVQSSTMALMAACGEITPMPNAAIFADTQAEPAAVYKWLDWLEKQLPFPVYRVSKGNLTKDTLRVITAKSGNCYTKPGLPNFFRFPDGRTTLGRRDCTGDYKIDPIQKKMRELRGKDKVIQWIGISTDEASRMKPMMITKKIDGEMVKIPHPWIQNRWPLIEMNMSRRDCLAWMAKRGYPTPPRSACIYCPFHSDLEWSRLTPEELAHAAQFEKDLQHTYESVTTMGQAVPYLHRSCKPLDQVDFSNDEDRGQLNMFVNECEGMCGV